MNNTEMLAAAMYNLSVSPYLLPQWKALDVARDTRAIDFWTRRAEYIMSQERLDFQVQKVLAYRDNWMEVCAKFLKLTEHIQPEPKNRRGPVVCADGMNGPIAGEL